MNVGAWGQFSGGSGTVGDPYLIATATDLQTLSADPNDWGDHFRMTGDLDLTGVSLTPIGNDTVRFMGTLDGSGYTISNFGISSTGIDYVGLFGYVEGAEAEIRDLKAELEKARELLGELQERNFINDPRPKSVIAGGGYPMSPSLRKRVATFLEGSK